MLFNRIYQVSNVFLSINVQFATAETGFDCAKTGFEIEHKNIKIVIKDIFIFTNNLDGEQRCRTSCWAFQTGRPSDKR